MGFSFDKIDKTSNAKAVSKILSSLYPDPVKHMYESLPDLKEWYNENATEYRVNRKGFAAFNHWYSYLDHNKEKVDVLNIVSEEYNEKAGILNITFAKNLNGEETTHTLKAIRNDNHTVDVFLNTTKIDMGLLYYLAIIHDEYMHINAIHFDLNDYDLRETKYVVDVFINDYETIGRNLIFKDANFDIPKLYIPPFKFLYKDLDDIEKYINVNIFINYNSFNVFAKDRAEYLVEFMDNCINTFKVPHKIVYRSVYDIGDPIFGESEYSKLVYPTKIDKVIYNKQQFLAKKF